MNVARSRKLFPPSYCNSNMAIFSTGTSLQFRTQREVFLLKY